MNKEQLTERIRKLLALAQSPNQYEAEAAMGKASELMKEHQIAMSEVLVKELKSGGVVEGKKVRVSETYRSFVMDIGSAAGAIFDCEPLKLGGEATIYFIGQVGDVTQAEELFRYLFDSWKSIVSADTRNWKSDFVYPPSQYEAKKYKMGHGQGFGHALCRRANDLARERKRAVQATGTDLIVLKDQMIDQYKEDRNIKPMRQHKQQSEGYFEGNEAGRNIPLAGALEQTK